MSNIKQGFIAVHVGKYLNSQLHDYHQHIQNNESFMPFSHY